MGRRATRQNSNRGLRPLGSAPAAATGTTVAGQARKRGRSCRDSVAAEVADQPRKRCRPSKAKASSVSAPPPKQKRISATNYVQVQAPPDDGQPVLSARDQRSLRRNQIKDAQLLLPKPTSKSPILVQHPEPEPQVINSQVEPESQVIVDHVQPKLQGFEEPLQDPLAFTEVINSLPKLQAKDVKNVPQIKEVKKIEKLKPILQGFEGPPEPLMPTLTRERPTYNAQEFLPTKNFEEELGKFEAYLEDDVFSLSTFAVAGPVKVGVDVKDDLKVEEPVLPAEIESKSKPEWTPLETLADAHRISASTPLSDTAELEDWFLQSVPTPANHLDDREQVLSPNPEATGLSTIKNEVEGSLNQPPLTPKWEEFIQVMALFTPAPTVFGTKDDPTPLPTKNNLANQSKNNPTTSANFSNWRSPSLLSS